LGILYMLFIIHIITLNISVKEIIPFLACQFSSNSIFCALVNRI
jgi:hypothetical protein